MPMNAAGFLRSLCAMLLILVTLPAGSIAADDDATHAEIEPIKFEIGPEGRIETMAMDNAGNLLCGVSWIVGRVEKRDAGAADEKTGSGDKEKEGDDADARPNRPRPAQRPDPRQRRPPLEDTRPRDYALKIVTPVGKVTATWPLKDVQPKMIHVSRNGDVFVGGGERLSVFDTKGKPLYSLEVAQVFDGKYKGSHVSGVTANDDYYFVAFGDGRSLRATEDVVRFDRKLDSAKMIVEQQFGCCGHIDLDVKGDVLLIAENSRHRVNRFTFDGEKLDTWGQRDRTNIEGFAACCNPVNFDFGPDGVLYTAESGIGRVKKYTAEGKYLGFVGYVDTTKFDRGSRLAAQSCYIPVEVSSDGKRIYIMDVRAHFIRILAEKENVGG